MAKIEKEIPAVEATLKAVKADAPPQVVAAAEKKLQVGSQGWGKGKFSVKGLGGLADGGSSCGEEA